MTIGTQESDQEGYYNDSKLVFLLGSHIFEVRIEATIEPPEEIESNEEESDVESTSLLPYEYAVQESPVVPRISSFDSNGLLTIKFNYTMDTVKAYGSSEAP